MILMDCHLPVVDGYAATESIRKLDMPYCEVPIIALTANATNEDRLKCLKAGMDDYLAKPIDLEKLREKVSKFISPDSGISFSIIENFSKSVDLLTSEMHFTPEEARNILNTFVASVPEYIQKLDEASEADRRDEIAGMAHQMKGTCLNLRLCQLQAASAALDAAVKDGSRDYSSELNALKNLLLKYMEGMDGKLI